MDFGNHLFTQTCKASREQNLFPIKLYLKSLKIQGLQLITADTDTQSTLSMADKYPQMFIIKINIVDENICVSKQIPELKHPYLLLGENVFNAIHP